MRNARLASLSAVLGLMVISPFGSRGAGAQGTADMSAQAILAHTATTYAHCTSYQDAGVVKIVYLKSGGSPTE